MNMHAPLLSPRGREMLFTWKHVCAGESCLCEQSETGPVCWAGSLSGKWLDMAELTQSSSVPPFVIIVEEVHSHMLHTFTQGHGWMGSSLFSVTYTIRHMCCTIWCYMANTLVSYCVWMQLLLQLWATNQGLSCAFNHSTRPSLTVCVLAKGKQGGSDWTFVF